MYITGNHTSPLKKPTKLDALYGKFRKNRQIKICVQFCFIVPLAKLMRKNWKLNEFPSKSETSYCSKKNAKDFADKNT